MDFEKLLKTLWIDPHKPVRVTAFDLETTVYNQEGVDKIVGDFAGSPWHPRNRIVMGGWQTLEGRIDSDDLQYEVSEPDVETWYNPEVSYAIDRQLSRDFCRAFKNSRIIVGQNIAFDLHYVRGVIERELGSSDFYFDLLEDTLIWDVQLGLFDLSGQNFVKPSMDTMSPIYGLELKDDKIKEYWDEGVMTEDIPYEELLEYQQADVAKTMYIGLSQMLEAIQRGMWSLIVASQEGRLATIDAEYNGMVFQAREAAKKGQEIEKELEVYDERVRKIFDWKLDKHPKVNPGSDQQLSIILFGGEYRYKESEHVLDEDGNLTYAKKKESQFTGEYYKKTGEPKYKKVDVPDYDRPKMGKVEKTETVKGVFKVEMDSWRGKDGTPKTNDDVLQRIKKQKGKPDWAYQLIDDILMWRELDKDLNTYYKGFCSLTWPHDGKIHGNINHTVAATSRLSSSNPNCFPPGVEVLTERGWMDVSEVPEGIKLAQAEFIDSLPISYDYPVDYIEYGYEGDLVWMASSEFESISTPDHRFSVWEGNEGWSQVTAENYCPRVNQPLIKNEFWGAGFTFIHPNDFSKKKVPYSGKVYCFTMPKDSLVIRYNGKVSIVKNCQNLAKDKKGD